MFSKWFKSNKGMDITVKELKTRLDQGENLVMIDVREPQEWAVQHLDQVKKIALGELPAKLPDLADLKDQEIVMICRSGNRSGRATQFLIQNGFPNARNLAGGMIAWKKEIDPSFQVG